MRNRLFGMLPKITFYKVCVYVLVIVSLMLFGSNWITLTGLSTNDRRSLRSSARETLQKIDEYADDSYSSYYFEAVEDETGVDVIKMIGDSRSIVKAIEDAGFSPNEFRQLLSFSRKYWNALASDFGDYNFSGIFGMTQSDVDKGSAAITAASLGFTVVYLAVIIAGILTFVFSFLRKRRAPLAYSIAYTVMFVIIAAVLIWFRTRGVESYFFNDEFGTGITASAVIGVILAVGASVAQHKLEAECDHERRPVPNITDLLRRGMRTFGGAGNPEHAPGTGYTRERRAGENPRFSSGTRTAADSNSPAAGTAGRTSGSVQVCPACNRIVADEDVYCGVCGTKTQKKPRIVSASHAAAGAEGMDGHPRDRGKFCPHCGAHVLPGSKFCSECGRPLP